MSRRRKTGWIDGDLAPARRGVYQRRWAIGPMYHLWDGRRWRQGAWSAEHAARETYASSHQPGRRRNNSAGVPWRGLAEPPA